MSADRDDVVDLGAAETPAAADDGVVNVGEGAEKLPPNATLQANGSVELMLDYPVVLKTRDPKTGTVTEERWEKFVMHRFTGSDMRAIQAASNETRGQVAIARSAKISDMLARHVWDRMDGADIAAASEVAAYFLESGRRTGR